MRTNEKMIVGNDVYIDALIIVIIIEKLIARLASLTSLMTQMRAAGAALCCTGP